jgi:hypothetical protein
VEVSAEWYQRVLGMERKDFDPGHGKQKRISQPLMAQSAVRRNVRSSLLA